MVTLLVPSFNIGINLEARAQDQIFRALKLAAAISNPSPAEFNLEERGDLQGYVRDLPTVTSRFLTSAGFLS